MGLAHFAAVPIYGASGRYLGLPFEKAAEKVIDTVTKVPMQAVKSLWSKVTEPISKYSKTPSKVDISNPYTAIPKAIGSSKSKQLSREMDEGFINPINVGVSNRKAREPIEDQFYDNLIKDVAGDTALSAAESAVHYDETAGEGAVAGAFGSGIGKMFGAGLERAPNMNSESAKDVLKWAESKGFRTLPGLKLNQPKYQRFESDLRSDDKFSSTMAAFDEANDKIVTKIAGEAMGIDNTSMKALTPETLEKHLANLKNQYQSLESNSVGVLSKNDMKGIYKNIITLPKKEQAAVREQVQRIVDSIKTKPRNEKGQFTNVNFSGKDYQNIRTDLKTAKDTAFKKGNMASYNALEDLILKLDNGMQSGISKSTDDNTVKLWKDLNEKWAMTDLVMKNGMDPIGGVNANKLSGYFMGPGEVNRTLLGRGGRVKDLQKIAKLNYIQRKQAGGGLNRLTAGGEDDRWDPAFKKQSFLNTPWSLKLPALGRAKVKMYQAGYPASTGLLNLNRQGDYSAAKLGRALEQSADTRTGAYDMAKTGLMNSYDFIDTMLFGEDKEENKKGSE